MARALYVQPGIAGSRPQGEATRRGAPGERQDLPEGEFGGASGAGWRAPVKHFSLGMDVSPWHTGQINNELAVWRWRGVQCAGIHSQLDASSSFNTFSHVGKHALE